MIAALFSLSVVSQAPLISRHFTVLTIIGFLSYSPWPHGLIMAAIAPDSSHLNCVQNQKDPHHPGKRKSKKEKWERQRKRDYLTVFSPFMKAKYFPRAPLLISAYLIDQNWVTWHPWNQGLSALIFFWQGRKETTVGPPQLFIPCYAQCFVPTLAVGRTVCPQSTHVN